MTVCLLGAVVMLTGCVAQEPVVQGEIETVSEIPAGKKLGTYNFNFPDTGWVMEFNYGDGFEVTEFEGSLVFVLGPDNGLMFMWNEKKVEPVPELLVSKEEFVAQGFWGEKHFLTNKDVHYKFQTPDEKYWVTVAGTPDVVDEFVEGMKLKK